MVSNAKLNSKVEALFEAQAETKKSHAQLSERVNLMDEKLSQLLSLQLQATVEATL